MLTNSELRWFVVGFTLLAGLSAVGALYFNKGFWALVVVSSLSCITAAIRHGAQE